MERGIIRENPGPRSTVFCYTMPLTLLTWYSLSNTLQADLGRELPPAQDRSHHGLPDTPAGLHVRDGLLGGHQRALGGAAPAGDEATGGLVSALLPHSDHPAGQHRSPAGHPAPSLPAWLPLWGGRCLHRAGGGHHRLYPLRLPLERHFLGAGRPPQHCLPSPHLLPGPGGLHLLCHFPALHEQAAHLLPHHLLCGRRAQRPPACTGGSCPGLGSHHLRQRHRDIGHHPELWDHQEHGRPTGTWHYPGSLQLGPRSQARSYRGLVFPRCWVSPCSWPDTTFNHLGALLRCTHI